MNDKKFVPVISMVRGINILYLPEYHYSRTWPKKGTKIMVDREILANSIYQPGVERMFTEGNLWIDDQEFRIELGLETAPVEGDEVEAKTLVKLDDKLLNRIIKLMPVSEVKATIETLSPAQRLEVADYAVEHYQDLKMDRIEVLTKLCDTDILKAVEMKKGFEQEA